MRKPAFCICENKDADQLRGNREADQHLCFRYTDIQSLFFLKPKFQASSHLLWLYSPVCVGPGQKPRRPVFSERGSNEGKSVHLCSLTPVLLILWFFLFDLMLYVHGKQLRSCWDGQLPNHTVPGQAFQRQFTIIKCPIFRQ